MLVAHVEWIIGSDHYAAGAEYSYEVVERRLGVRQRIEIEPANIFGRQSIDVHLRLRPNPPAMIPAPADIGRVASAVGQIDREVRVPGHDAAKDEARDRDRSVERVPNQIAQVITPQPVGGGRSVRMNEDRYAQRFDPSEERLELGFIQVAAADMASYF